MVRLVPNGRHDIAVARQLGAGDGHTSA